MKLEIGQHIKCYFKNSLIIEGIVQNWFEKECVLKSVYDKDSLFIIPNFDEVIVIKIVPSSDDAVKVKTELEQKFEETYNRPSDDDLRLKDLAQLRVEIVKQDKEIIAHKLKSHYLGQIKRTEYGQPGFFKK